MGGENNEEEVSVVCFKDKIEEALPDLDKEKDDDKCKILDELIGTTIVTMQGHAKSNDYGKTYILDKLITSAKKSDSKKAS